uniref:Aminotransferase-like plant mobile domain-containing protein n=1 Tax=Fagus sylvatica TaxID=28930 RepID=A0A2N9GHJ1_FAGSY
MASSSKKPMKGRGGSSAGKGGVRTPRDPEADGSSSESVLGSPEPHGDILGRPILDPWYRSSERFPSVPAGLQPPPADWEWLIQRNEMLAVPLVFDFQCSRAVEWADWIDSELSDREFCDCLERAGVLRSVLISRGSNMYRDTEALRQLVRRWCPSTHTFFFAHGEMTVTLEDVENHWLLPILDYIGRKNIALGTQAARFKAWMEHFNRETRPTLQSEGLKVAAFVAYWLSKCVFGVCFPLAPLLLGQIYTQLDLLHAEELAGASCHIASTAFNSSIVHTFLWEHALEYISLIKSIGTHSFGSMLLSDVPAVYRWVGSKFDKDFMIIVSLSPVPSLDNESKVCCWRPYGVSHRGFMYESVMSGFSNIEAQDYSVIAGDTASLTYLSATNAGWLPVLSSDGLRFTVYSAHRVRKQFGFDQEVPAVMGVAAGEIPTLCERLELLLTGAVSFRVIIPDAPLFTQGSPRRVDTGRKTFQFVKEWRISLDLGIWLMSGYPGITGCGTNLLHAVESTMLLAAKSPKLGLCVWHHEDSRWVTHGSPHPPLWLRDHPHVAASGKAPSSRGKRNVPTGASAAKRKQPERSSKGETPSKDSPAQASKRQKASAMKGSKETLVLKAAAAASPPLTREDVPQGVSAPISKRTVKKTRAGKKTFVPPAFPGAPSSIAARVAARKSSRGVVYSEKRSKQRADTSSRVPIEIPDDLDSSSSSSDPSGAVEEEVERESVGAGVAETVSGAGDFAADISSAADIGSVDTDAFLMLLLGKRMKSRGDTEDDEVSMDELEAAEASSESTPVASAMVVLHKLALLGAAVAWIPPCYSIQVLPLANMPEGLEGGSIVSTDSERTGSATVRVSTPPSPLPESGGIASTPIIITAAVSAATIIQESETATSSCWGSSWQ